MTMRCDIFVEAVEDVRPSSGPRPVDAACAYVTFAPVFFSCSMLRVGQRPGGCDGATWNGPVTAS